MTNCERSPEVLPNEYEATFFEDFEIDGKKWSLPVTWKKQGEGFRNFKAKSDDVWVITQPRSGTTLTQELVWLLANNMDFDNAKKFHLLHRSPELPASLFPNLWKKCELLRPSQENPKVLESVPVDTTKNSYEVYVDSLSPRIFKTHLALSVHKNILDSGCKIVYVARNPKDNLVSKARFAADGPNPFFKSGLKKYMEDYIETDGLFYGPYWPHLKEAWDLREHPNVLFLFYEEMRSDLPGSIRKVAKFLGKNYSDEEFAKLEEHLNIDNFRKNPMVNELPGYENVPAFIGAGRVGGWREIMTPEFEAKIDRWIEHNIERTGIVFPDLKRC
ncbi:sulfotransferase 4A1-like [Venturia canescens]|uniref:sulfotransferase 4A1-like n=1 Tax=Venturia canescens TaxID=32260 RepID=UPI001C9D1AD2|nr:sulfotransferase 4A1-like [Venturia canescens]